MLKALTSWALVLGSLASAVTASANTITWEDHRAIALGNGCNSLNTLFLANGNDLSVVFSDLGVYMPGGAGMPLAERKTCQIRVPARIASGFYVGQLTQNLSYGITKTAGARGAIATRSTFFGVPASPFSISYGLGSSVNVPLQTASRVDNYLVHSRSLCRSPVGLFSSALTVSGQRNSDWEDLIMQSDSLDVRFEAVAGLVICPRP